MLRVLQTFVKRDSDYVEPGVQTMKFDSLTYPFSSRRSVVYAEKGMVATAQPLAAQAGLRILMQGGNAVDAAIATAACLTVVEPTANGIGGDAFAIISVNGKLHGLNASGYAPHGISREAVRARGHEKMPHLGVLPITVPGAPAGWVEMSRRFGRLPLEDVLKPAIDYAQNGYPLSPGVAHDWARAAKAYGAASDKAVASWFETFARGGFSAKPGARAYLPDHAATLMSIAKSAGESFYRGELAEKMAAFVQANGGFLTRDDLAAYAPEWVDPIGATYRGHTVWEIPPNGQGIIAQMALRILDSFLFAEFGSAHTVHVQLEAMKMAFSEGLREISDPRAMRVSVESLLSDAFARSRAARICEQALDPDPVTPHPGGTVYLATADGDGQMVSMIQSNYMGFGSGVVVPGTGISMQNRGHTFSLDESHVNRLEPGKKTYHTIIPGFLTKGDTPIGPFGVMGGFMQPQGHVQVIMNTLDFHMNPQAALDAPRWQWTAGKSVEVEHTMPAHVIEDLVRRGHDVRVQLAGRNFGRGQIIWRDEQGVFCGGTEARADGQIAAW